MPRPLCLAGVPRAGRATRAAGGPDTARLPRLCRPEIAPDVALHGWRRTDRDYPDHRTVLLEQSAAPGFARPGRARPDLVAQLRRRRGYSGWAPDAAAHGVALARAVNLGALSAPVAAVRQGADLRRFPGRAVQA